jgi:hypothetical protein
VLVNSVNYTKQPASVNSCTGNTVTLSGVAISNASFIYQWQKNGINIPGANTNTLTLNNVTTLDGGIYRLAAILPCGTIYSNNATVSVGAIPAPPAYSNVTYCQFDTAKPLNAGGNILNWYTVATSGLSSQIAPIPNTITAGTYQYWVSNTSAENCESARYPVTVTINPAPTVSLTALSNPIILPSQTVTLKAIPSVNALGARWYYNGVNFGSTPNNEYIVGFNKLGNYQAEAVTSLGCKALSEIVVVKSPSGFAPSTSGSNLFIYPNPATTVVNMYFDNPINEDAEVRVVNTAGQVLQTRKVRFTNRFQPVQMNVTGLRADAYTLEILNSKGLSIARNILIKAN